MSRDQKSLLCVGGPCAGQYRTLLYGTSFRVANSVPLPIASMFDQQIAAATDITVVEYRAEKFHTPQGVIEFWAPTTQTPFDSMKLLLETYERAAKGTPRAAGRKPEPNDLAGRIG